MKRRIRKTLQKKYDLRADDKVQFAYFPDQKVKPLGDIGIVTTPPQFNREIEEVDSIVKSLSSRHVSSQDVIKDLFHEKGWEKDYVFFPEEGLWSFDAYKNGVAVEILGKHIDEIYKDCFKFLLAFKAKKVKIGVIVIPHRKVLDERPDAVIVDSVLHRFSPVLQDYRLWIYRASYSVES